MPASPIPWVVNTDNEAGFASLTFPAVPGIAWIIDAITISIANTAASVTASEGEIVVTDFILAGVIARTVWQYQPAGGSTWVQATVAPLSGPIQGTPGASIGVTITENTGQPPANFWTAITATGRII